MNQITSLITSDTFQAKLAGLARFQANGLDPDDVVQEITARMLARAGRFAGKGIGYAVRFATWSAQDLAKAGNREADRLQGCAGEIMEHLVTVPDAESVVERREWLADLHRRLSSLPPRQRAVAEMLAAGYGRGEIAQHLRLTPAGVRQAIKRIRQNLQ